MRLVRSDHVPTGLVERLVGARALAVALVGSRATGDATEDSDLDLAVVGDGPHYRLERHAGLLVSLGWADAEEQRRRLRDPTYLGMHVPGWRDAVLLHDPDGIGAAIQRAARDWSWDEVAKACDAWVAESVTGLAEEGHKLLAALRRHDATTAAVQRSVIALGLAAPIAIHRRLLYGSENRLWDLVARELGPPWDEAQSSALGLRAEDADESARAALRLFGLAADEVAPLLDDRQRAVLDPLWLAAEDHLREAEIHAATVGGERERHDAPVELVDYRPEWPRLFEREAARIRHALGERVVLLEHVGSTAVPGLIAKPRIDMLLVVADSADESAYVTPLKATGYVLHIREPQWHEHRLLKGPDTEVNLHVFSTDCPESDRLLLFRDRLRAHAGDRELYARTKRELAAQTWEYVQNYADAKSDVVEEILARARAERTEISR